MPQYSYTAKAGPKDSITDTMVADNRNAVIKHLKAQGLFPLVIQEVSVEAEKRKPGRVRKSAVSEFTRQLAELIQAGIPLAKAIATLKAQEQTLATKKMLGELEEKVLHGLSFSDALSSFPKLFSSFYVTMVRIGESSGQLFESLNRLAEFKEREGELRGQILSAIAYPAFITAVGFLTIFFMVTFFIPRLSGVFSDLGQELPLLTLMVMGISAVLQKTWWLLALLVSAAVVIFRSLIKREEHRLRFDGILLSLPFLKTVIRKIETSRFSYALGILLQNGVPMVSALHIIGASVENRVFRKTLNAFEDKIRKGKDLSSCLKEASLFPPVVVNMVRVGEESGGLGDMLLKAADIFEKQVNRTIKTMVSLVEPALILVIGGMVVVIVFAMLFPIFEMNLIIQ